jgi:hypothetical protein
MRLFWSFLIVTPMLAQHAKEWDTLKYQGFKSNLIIGVFQCYREFNNQFTERGIKDPAGHANALYQAEANNITGIMINYDKVILQVGLRSTPRPPNPKKGKTETFVAQLNIGGNMWFLENSFKYFKGFYDENTSAHSPGLRNAGDYYRQPGMVNSLLSNRFMYFTNHKRFAYRAAYAGNFRQLKSAATWVLSAGTKIFGLTSDSSFFARPAWEFYGGDAPLEGLRATSLAANIGPSATIVILRSLFANALVIVGPEIQWRSYDYGTHTSRLTYLALSGSLRIAFGINYRRCFFTITSVNDFTTYHSSSLQVLNKSLTGMMSFGWRFNSATPAFYKKFQETKIYKAL